MIISYPTGFYERVLPNVPSDSSSVTFVISNTIPPRTNLVFPKLSSGIESARKAPSISRSRIELGQLIFTISQASRQVTGNNAKQYGLGDVLTFDDVLFKTVEPMLVSESTEIRHDTNVFDYNSIGLTEAEQSLTTSSATETYAILTDQLNLLRRQRADAEQIINVQQKIINETSKTIEALEIVVKTSPMSEIQDLLGKLNLKKTEAFAIRDEAITNANSYAQQAVVVMTEMQTMALLVK